MQKQPSFDWYQLSKQPQQNPNIQSFLSLLKNAHIGQQISQVPISLRQKLLIMFQNVSKGIKNRYMEEMDMGDELGRRKQAMMVTLGAMREELEVSMGRLKADGVVVEEKKKVLEKLKEKVQKKQKQKQKQKAPPVSQVYFCPLCTRQDFKSRNEFSFHLLKAHSTNFPEDPNTSQSLHSQPQSQSSQSIPADIKDLILSLKDKQIQLMQMMLSKKKQMETMELEKIYELELRKIRTQANFVERRTGYNGDAGIRMRSQGVDYSEEEEELKGESQYLFYQNQRKSNQPQAQEIHDEGLYRNFYSGPGQQGHSQYIPPINFTNNNERYASHLTAQKPQILPQPVRPDYYNIFTGQDNALSVQNSLSPQKIHQFNPTNPKHPTPTPLQPYPNHPIHPIHPTQTQPSINRNLIFERTPINPIRPKQNQQYSYSKIYQYGHGGEKEKEREKDREMGERSQSKMYGTVYEESKRDIGRFGDAHIFNSGPLMDDVGDGSDFQDYFGEEVGKGGRAAQQDQVADEQIIVRRPQPHQMQSTKSLTSPKNLPIRSKPQITSPTIQPPPSTSSQSHLPQPQPFPQHPKKPNPNPFNSPNPQPPQQQPPLHNNSINSSNILLEYSKDKSFLQISRSKDQISHSQSQSNVKDRSSELIQLSNSFSKGGLEFSKNQEESVNLSDLRFSKFQREREKERERIRLGIKTEQTEEQHHQQPQIPKKPQPFYSTNPNPNPKPYQSNPSILQQFHRDPTTTMPYTYNMKKTPIQRTEQIPVPPPSIPQPKIKMPEQMDLMKTNSKILEEFLYRPSYNYQRD